MGKTSTIGTKNAIWIISDSKPSSIDLNSFGLSGVTGPIREYQISQLAWYLLNPEPIVIMDRLVGCYITFKKSGYQAFKDALKAPFRKKKDSETPRDNPLTREYSSSLSMKTFTFKDKMLENHFRGIYDALRPYDSLLRALPSINTDKITDITGICEDIAGNRYKLDLQGTVRDKLNYMVTNLLTLVRITMKKAYLSKGLFELRGYRFDEYNPEVSYRMLRFLKDGKTTFCVLGHGSHPGFVVEETTLVYWLQLFEQSLRSNQKLLESMQLCIRGEAKPFKLFFTKQLEFSYSQNHLPKIFKNNYDVTRLAPEERTLIAESLNNQQRVISFNYIPHSDSGDDKMHTNISVMHDVRALEPIKDQLPGLYNSIYENAPSSDAGKFYLLDALKGCQDE